jgi:Tfp pilus assembly protein PilE|tara:strand:+ start:525 stop:920 length:396 start_codon:yes stop_codon:yes gene_type:complete
MQQILIGIILVLGFGSYWLYNENNTLKANNAALEGAIATQEEAISTLQNDFALQTTQLQNMTLKSQAAQRELNRYTQFIQNYQLTAKILTDPIEMQRKINNGTKHIMEDIEKISVTVDDLDDGLQLQPNTD